MAMLQILLVNHHGCLGGNEYVNFVPSTIPTWEMCEFVTLEEH